MVLEAVLQTARTGSALEISALVQPYSGSGSGTGGGPALVHGSDGRGRTALHHACAHHNLPGALWLLQVGGWVGRHPLSTRCLHLGAPADPGWL